MFYEVFENKTLDNVTSLIICFKSEKKHLFTLKSRQTSLHQQNENYIAPEEKKYDIYRINFYLMQFKNSIIRPK